MKKAALFTLVWAAVVGVLTLVPHAQQPAPAPAGQAAQAPGGLGATFGLGGWNETPPPTRKVVLIWADRGTSRGHSATSHAIGVIEQLGYDSGLWETEIQTTSQFITLGAPVPPGSAVATPRGQVAPAPAGRVGGPAGNPGGDAAPGGGGGFNLRNVDAIFAIGGRPAALTDQQKRDLLQWVREGGGFVGSHGALIQFSESWPEYKEMLGGFHEGHPFNGAQSPGYLINEDPTNPIVRHIPRNWLFFDEYYMIRDFDRTKNRVLLRLDASKAPAVHAMRNPQNDYPVAWARNYGRGRVFYSTLAHGLEGWDNPNVRRMYLEALKWATGQSTGVDVTPRPMPGTQAPPRTAPVPKGGQNPAGTPCTEQQTVSVSGQPFCFEGPLPVGESHGTTGSGPGRGGAGAGRGGNGAGRGGN